jgi:thioredoxin-related protein
VRDKVIRGTRRRPDRPRRFVSCALFAAHAAFAPLHAHGAQGFDDSAISKVEYPDWFQAADFMDLRDHLDEAGERGKRGLMLFFTTQGCSYCHLFLKKSLSDEEIVERVRGNFDVLGLEIFSDAELTSPDGETMPVKLFAKREGIQFAPSLLFYATDGEPLLRVTGYYEPARFERVLDYLVAGVDARGPFHEWEREQLEAESQEQETQALIASPLFSPPPHALDRSRVAAAQPLLVIFERPGCGRCPQFHEEVLQDPEVASKLAAFEVVRLDASDEDTPVLRPDGTRSNGADWARELGFNAYPALLFVDEQGGEILATDALVLRGRMTNLLGLVADKAYAKGWTYQRYARKKALERAAAGTGD